MALFVKVGNWDDTAHIALTFVIPILFLVFKLSTKLQILKEIISFQGRYFEF